MEIGKKRDRGGQGLGGGLDNLVPEAIPRPRAEVG